MFSFMHTLRTMHVPAGAVNHVHACMGFCWVDTPSKPVGVVSLYESQAMRCMGLGTLAGLGRWSEHEGCPAGDGGLLQLVYMAGACTGPAHLPRAERRLDVAGYRTHAFFTSVQTRTGAVKSRAQP